MQYQPPFRTTPSFCDLTPFPDVTTAVRAPEEPLVFACL
ncbi:hypothetical protein F750_4674 [Streptomyces sp. PAMC 26508]|nr:hypothetical protein F750_4674 [Streptomyces sp. PAMC 26508]